MCNIVNNDQLKQAQHYWKCRLADLEVTKLLSDFPTSQQTAHEIAHVYYQIDMKVLNDIRTWVHQEKKEVDIYLVTAFIALLSRYTHSSNLVIGSNGLILRVDLSDNPPGNLLLNRVQETVQEARRYSTISFEEIIALVNPSSHRDCQPATLIEWDFQSVHDSHRQPTPRRSNLHMLLQETEQGITLICEYAASLYRTDTISRLLKTYVYLVKQIVEKPDKHLLELSLLSAEEEHLLTQIWSNGPEQPIVESTLHQLFAEQTQVTPDAIAVMDSTQHLSYHALNQRANQLAHYLKQHDVQQKDKVIIWLERSPDAIMAVLAVLKAGAAYVPVDPTCPQERLHRISDDAQAKVIITQFRLVQHLTSVDSLLFLVDQEAEAISQQDETEPLAELQSNNLAYVIYTSGSTGMPKGVLIEHRSVVNFVMQISQVFEITREDHILQFASLGFDVSVFELFTPLLLGGTLVIASDLHKKSPKRLTSLMQTTAVTLAELPPALLPLLQSADLPTLRLLSVGGEKFPGELIEHWATANRKMINGYGPTETTVAVTLFECTGRWSMMPPIGRPMPNHRVYVLDPQLRPVPIGVAGELHIAGVGVAQGYLNRPTLTYERFITNPYSDDPCYARMYKTGDQVRWLPDSNLEIMGRIDRQIKVHGFRIELGELEALLTAQDTIKQAVVEPFPHKDGGLQLIAYLVLEPEMEVSIQVLQQDLLQHLPIYMLPSHIIILAEIPLTVNGKVNRRALPLPEGFL